MGYLKKNIKWIILVIVLIIIASGISVYATTTYLANQVIYKDGKTVEEALNDLYNKIPKGEKIITENGTYDISDKASVNVNITMPEIDYSTSRTYYMGNRASGNTRSISLTKGTYIVSVVNAHAWASSSKFNYNGEINSNASSWISVTNGSCQLLTGYYVQPTATNKTDDTKYVSQYTYSNVYKCILTSDGSISITTNDGTYNDCTQGIIMQTIKID